MKFNSFSLKGAYKQTDTSGRSLTYNLGDIVEINSNYYICTGTTVISNPLSNVGGDWLKLSESQIFYATEEEPFFSKSGDEWLDTSTGVKYKRISDNNGSHWVEI